MEFSEPDLSFPYIEYWTKMPGWRLREAAALLLCLDPDKTKDLENGSSDKAAYQHLKRYLFRCRDMNILDDPHEPVDLLNWCASNRITVPIALKNSVAKEHQLQNWRIKYRKLRRRYNNLKSNSRPTLEDKDFDAPEPDPRRLRSIYILLCAYAHENGFGKDKGAVNNIVEYAENIGLPIKRNAVTDALREAINYRKEKLL